ncbi:3'-5' exonuclease [Alteromonas sp. CYL-A6]|uniref:3'-5' exonuclease n=1 Tax=Alteromonas nitratireducens TaxID=3390813 RepID=UPI0034A9D4C4
MPIAFIPTILDIEASGFGVQSYPIEIGVARSDGARYCRLIRPLPHWTHWEAEAQMLHGITRAELTANGTDAVRVCHELNQFLAGRQVYSDGWVVDYPWLIRLFGDVGIPMQFSFSDIEYVLNSAQMSRWHMIKSELQSLASLQRHRASADAHLIQQTFIQSAS